MKGHQIEVTHGKTSRVVTASCSGKGCPLCASTAENRARISFVKAR